MPTYKLPKPKKRDEEVKTEPASIDGDMDDYRRRITIPVNDAILDALQIDEEVTVTLSGTLTGMAKTINEHYKEKSITITVTEVSAYSSDESEEMGMEAGYEEG